MNRMRPRPKQAGFTMIELMVVVLIVGVLAAIAIPIYGKYIKNSRLSEATGRIGEIITASKSYAQEHQDTSGNPTWPSGAAGIVDLTATELFSYAITHGGGNGNTDSLVITATGVSGQKMAGVAVVVSVPDINKNGLPPRISGL